MQYGTCRNLDPKVFFVEDDDDDDVVSTKTTTALGACNRCVVRKECLAHAQAHPEHYGIWGGTTEEQRKTIKTRRRRVRCPSCQSSGVEELAGRTEVCMHCGLTWKV